MTRRWSACSCRDPSTTGEGGEETPIGWALGLPGSRRRTRASRGLWRWSADRRPSSSRVDTGQPDPAKAVAPPRLRMDGVATEGVSSRSRDRERRFHRHAAAARADGGARAALHRVTRLSFSALALFERCSYRYYAERVAECSRPPGRTARDSATASGACMPPRSATLCTGCSSFNLIWPPAAPEGLEELVRSWYPAVTDDEACTSWVSWRVLRLDARAAARRARRRAGRAAVRVRPGRRPPNGRLDVLWRSGSRARPRLQDELPGGPTRPRSSRPSTSPSARRYALARLRACADEVEVVYQLEAPEAVVSATFTRADAAALEAEPPPPSRGSRRATSGPTPSAYACSAARRSTASARGLPLGSAPDGLPLPELTSAG